MPEGPQMVFLKILAEEFVGQTVVAASGTAKGIPFEKITGSILVDIKTYGKELLFCFPEFTIRVHLMLFGKFAINSTLQRVLKIGFEFGNGEINFYSSDCRFIDKPLDEVYNWKADVMNEAFDKDEACRKLAKKRKDLICEALMDQNILAGVGNKIKNESLFASQVHPQSIVSAIPEKKLGAIIEACVRLSGNYLQWQQEGEVEPNWKVYKKSDCPRDHIPLMKEKIGKTGRTSYFCEKCQELYI
ncbi:endonuclease [Desertivirga brevis]|uniref:endonuclease n=1 Tax=Desertivirga brevis TaxID=2810310 RepID=UPI001A96BDD9|nr:endonuclease [Pedobacter sp. SYSU D00873]